MVFFLEASIVLVNKSHDVNIPGAGLSGTCVTLLSSSGNWLHPNSSGCGNLESDTQRHVENQLHSQQSGHPQCQTPVPLTEQNPECFKEPVPGLEDVPLP